MGIVDTDKYCYVMTYSFPCQSLSKSGKQEGMAKGSNTRSGLLWEVERLLNETKELPQFLLMENVPDVLSDKFVKDFADWVAFLDSLGYTSKWAVINAKEQGIPQNRERCFMLSWLEKDCYYLFPQPQKLTKRLKDVLETEVDEKYYLSDRQIEMGEENAIAEPVIYDDYNRHIKRDQSCIGTLTTNCGNNAEGNGVKIIEPSNYRFYQQAYETLQANSCEYGDTIDAYNKRVNKDGVSPTITTRPEGFKTAILPITCDYRIRKLTPLETWRLMNFDDEDFERASKVCSRSKLYRQAGNSIVVNVLVEIFRPLLTKEC